MRTLPYFPYAEMDASEREALDLINREPFTVEVKQSLYNAYLMAKIAFGADLAKLNLSVNLRKRRTQVSN